MDIYEAMFLRSIGELDEEEYDEFLRHNKFN